MGRSSSRFWTLSTALILAGCGEVEMSEPNRSYPEPIEVYDDPGKASPRAVAPRPAPVPAAGASPQFECAAGAPDVTATMKSEAADRPDDEGQPMSVTVYDPTGVQVFGFRAIALERFARADGRTGIAAYVEPGFAEVRGAMLARFPGSTGQDATRFSGPDMAGAVTLEEATLGNATVTRIECAFARQGN